VKEGAMPINHTQSRLRDGHPVLVAYSAVSFSRNSGCWQLDSTVFIDCEHGGFDLETIRMSSGFHVWPA
jgi:hypothetical protein